jgi:hypothetical protein
LKTKGVERFEIITFNSEYGKGRDINIGSSIKECYAKLKTGIIKSIID